MNRGKKSSGSKQRCIHHKSCDESLLLEEALFFKQTGIVLSQHQAEQHRRWLLCELSQRAHAHLTPYRTSQRSHSKQAHIQQAGHVPQPTANSNRHYGMEKRPDKAELDVLLTQHQLELPVISHASKPEVCVSAHWGLVLNSSFRIIILEQRPQRRQLTNEALTARDAFLQHHIPLHSVGLIYPLMTYLTCKNSPQTLPLCISINRGHKTHQILVSCVCFPLAVAPSSTACLVPIIKS